MDIHERQSASSPQKWRAFQFSTLAVCVLGFLGNMSALVVLSRHLNKIAGSRPLLALAVADLGVVTSIASRTMAYVTYGNNQLTQVLDWWFLYCYYCSIYLTVMLSLDRYVHTAKAMLLLRINYHRLLKRAVLAVFVVMMIVTLPHLVANFVQYHYGSHVVIATYGSDTYRLCTYYEHEWYSDIFRVEYCNQHENGKLSQAKAQNNITSLLQDLRDAACSSGLSEWTNIMWQSYIPAIKFESTFRMSLRGSKLSICPNGMSSMRHDPDYVKVVYLSLDLPLRYILPCCALIIVNISLLVAVCRAQQHHRELTQSTRKSLLDLPVLWSSLAIVLIFLICHTGGAGLFVLDVYRIFASPPKGGLETTVNAFISESQATVGLEMKYSAYLLAAINSSVNIVLYCCFLPTFRKYWSDLYAPYCKQRKPTGKEPIQDMVTLKELHHPHPGVSWFLYILVVADTRQRHCCMFSMDYRSL